MIIYLHGFNSTGESAKGQALKEALGNEITIYTPTYHYDPKLAITGLSEYIQKKITQHADNEPRMIIGSSLGGFYAQYLARLFPGFKVVLINPALGPIDTLSNHLGVNTNFYSGEKYILEQKHLDALNNYNIASPCSSAIPTLVLIDKADEVINYHYAVEKYRPCGKIILYEEGDHQFQHLAESIPEINTFYYQKN